MLVLHNGTVSYETEGIDSPARHANTCFKFPLDGRAFMMYLHRETNRLRNSSFVSSLLANDLPSSKFPVGAFHSQRSLNHFQTKLLKTYSLRNFTSELFFSFLIIVAQFDIQPITYIHVDSEQLVHMSSKCK